MTLGSVIIHMNSVSFLRLIVSSCIAELDLFKLICRTLIFLPCSRDSGALDTGMAIEDCSMRKFVLYAKALGPSWIGSDGPGCS